VCVTYPFGITANHSKLAVEFEAEFALYLGSDQWGSNVDARQKIRVVLSDDHPIVRNGIRLLLGEAHDIAVVGEAADGPEALRLVDELQPDVLLLDMAMPGMNGIEVVQTLAARQSPVRVLALSAYDAIEYIRGALAYGAYGYLTKEEIPEVIVEAVRGVAYGEKGWLSQRISEKIQRNRIHEQEIEDHPLSRLSGREREVLALISQGHDNTSISECLCISGGTVKKHVTNIYTKLSLHSRAEAVAWAWEHNLVRQEG